jgi:hypothetical protein
MSTNKKKLSPSVTTKNKMKIEKNMSLASACLKLVLLSQASEFISLENPKMSQKSKKGRHGFSRAFLT